MSQILNVVDSEYGIKGKIIVPLVNLANKTIFFK